MEVLQSKGCGFCFPLRLNHGTPQQVGVLHDIFSHSFTTCLENALQRLRSSACSVGFKTDCFYLLFYKCPFSCSLEHATIEMDVAAPQSTQARIVSEDALTDF